MPDIGPISAGGAGRLRVKMKSWEPAILGIAEHWKLTGPNWDVKGGFEGS